ncbi:unnamed protein product [Amoebophrya sp. A25]|nr:unnamed protein product [Amoebophrya sp. A25]|eukprot:GSA25T00003552001.1
MSTSSAFFSLLQKRIEKVDSLLCVGLDPHQAELENPSAEAAVAFCEKLIKNTEHVACSYKPNAAFFEQFGSQGWAALEKVKAMIPEDIPIIFDCKRGDIGSTSAAYAIGNFQLGHCLTISPYLGEDGVTPFVDTAEKAAFVLCKTSNPGSNDLQTMMVAPSNSAETTPIPLYMHVAALCEKWSSKHGNIGLVVGATDTKALQDIRAKHPDVWFFYGVGWFTYIPRHRCARRILAGSVGGWIKCTGNRDHIADFERHIKSRGPERSSRRVPKADK